MVPGVFQILSGFEDPSIPKWIHRYSLAHSSPAVALLPRFVGAVGVVTAIPVAAASAAPAAAVVPVVVAATAFDSATNVGAALVGNLAVVIVLFAAVDAVLRVLDAEADREPLANIAESNRVAAVILLDSGSVVACEIVVVAAASKTRCPDLVIAEESAHPVSFVEALVVTPFAAYLPRRCSIAAVRSLAASVSPGRLEDLPGPLCRSGVLCFCRSGTRQFGAERCKSLSTIFWLRP